MTWTTPRTWTASEVVTAAMMNTHVRDNIAHLYPVVYDETRATDGLFGSGTFTLPTTYKHLFIVATLRTVQSTSVIAAYLRPNGDSTAGNYYNNYAIGGGSSATGTEQLGTVAGCYIGGAPGGTAGSDLFSTHLIHVPHYNDAGFHKTITARNSVQWGTSTGQLQAQFCGGTWKSTAAVTKIEILDVAGGNNWKAGSRLTVYGRL